jgi:hypothetical protein
MCTTAASKAVELKPELNITKPVRGGVRQVGLRAASRPSYVSLRVVPTSRSLKNKRTGETITSLFS